MKLIRLAVVQLASSAEDWHGSTYNIDGVPVQVLRARQRDKDHFLLLGADVPLEREPEINVDGYILVPEPQRKQAEAAIETFANLLAVSTRSSRRIFSPIPYVALIPEDQEAHDRLNRAKGLLLPSGGITFTPFHVSDDDCVRHLSGRSDGIALLAEALTQDHAVGRARELYRFFERAFACTDTYLGRVLKEFLKGTSNNFSATEINRWIKVRGPNMAMTSFTPVGNCADSRKGPETGGPLTRDTSPLLCYTSSARMPGAGEPCGCRPKTSRNSNSS